MTRSIRFTLLLTILITNLTSYGQHQWGVKINGGLSRITTSLGNAHISDIPFVPSGQAGFYYHRFLGKNSSLGTELLFSQIEGKEKLDDYLTDSGGNIIGHTTDIEHRHISYISLPVHYGVSMKRFILHAGFQLSYAFSSSGREKYFSQIKVYRQEITYYNSSKIDNINIKKVDFGPRVGVIYSLTDRLNLEGTFYRGLNNIQNGDKSFRDLKVQQMTLGVRYALWSK